MTEDGTFVNSLYTPLQPTPTKPQTERTQKYKTQRCKSPREQKAAALLRTFKREARQRGACCEVCWRSKSLASMAIVDTLWVDGYPRGAYAICQRCRSKYSRIESTEFRRLVELALTVDWLEVWG